jgi:hypothetical protein
MCTKKTKIMLISEKEEMRYIVDSVSKKKNIDRN